MDNLPELPDSIRELSKQLANSNSMWRIFFRGLLFGLGSAIGASIVAAVIIASFARFVQYFQNIPLLQMMK